MGRPWEARLLGKSFTVRLVCAAVCAAVCCAAFVPVPVCVCLAAATIAVGPVLALFFAVLCSAFMTVMVFGIVLPAWFPSVVVCAACVGTLAFPFLRGRLESADSPCPFSRTVASLYPPLGGGLILAALLVRVDAAPLWVVWGCTFLVIGYGQTSPSGARGACARLIVIRFGAGLVILLITAILLEGGVRVATAVRWNGAGLLTVPVDTKVIVPHPRRYYTLAPLRTATIPFKKDCKETAEFSFGTSSHGLRGAAFGPKGDGELRILLLGDSYTFGWGLEDGDTIAAVLRKELAQACPNRRVRVVNGGVWGYSVWQERDLLSEVGFALNPDIVVHLLFPGNDIDGAWERRGTFPKSYGVEWRNELLPYMHRQNWRFGLQDTLLRRWRTLALLTRAFPARLDQPVVALLAQLRFVPEYKVPRIPPPEDRPLGLMLSMAEWDAELSAAFTEMCGDIEGTRDDCRARGVQYAAAVIPTVFAVSEERWNEAVADHADQHYVRNRDVCVTEKALSDKGIPSIPLLAPLIEGRTRMETHYLCDGHFNPQGAVIVAKAIRSFLISEFLSEECTMRDQSAP
jgi:lysophospholipase L1-like esterase